MASDAAFSAIVFSASGALIGLVFTSAEYLYLIRAGQFSRSGVWDWRILGATSSTLVRIAGGLLRHPAVVCAAIIARIGLAIWAGWCLLTGSSALIPLLLLLALTFALAMRMRWGGEGGDQMTVVVLIATTIASFYPSSHAIALACTLFVAGQVTLAYVASGSAKLFGDLWRRGQALGLILNQHSYGVRAAAELAKSYPRAMQCVSLAVIGFQLSFPLFFVLPAPWHYAYLLIGVAFHLSIAILMRLNLFLWTFLGTYSCLIYAHSLVNPMVGRFFTLYG